MKIEQSIIYKIDEQVLIRALFMSNTQWKEYLIKQGAQITNENNSEELATFKNVEATAATPDGSQITPLLHLGMLSIKGLDSAKFLQGQITCDTNSVSPESSVLGAACSPKGRMYSSFRLIQRRFSEQPEYLARMRADIILSTTEILGKYSVFFKAQLEDVAHHWVGIGIIGSHCDDTLKTIFGSLPLQTNQVVQSGRGILIRTPGSQPRYECWITEDQAKDIWQQLGQHATPTDTHQWILQDIQSGLAEITRATVESFIPQMLNFQALGAISFDKGCYTGQEIVARTHYRGKAKRRLVRVSLDSAPALIPGIEIYQTGKSQSIATVVAAVAIDERYQEALLVMQADLADEKEWELDSEQHHFTARQLELPYAI